jgi:DNA-binding LacI/PurR family transcriptional regulator
VRCGTAWHPGTKATSRADTATPAASPPENAAPAPEATDLEYVYNQACKLICKRRSATTDNDGTATMAEADTPASLTIDDVAHLAGVSVSSARNYFSRPQVLSAPTHARIKAAVAQTGYVPRGSLAGLGRRQLGRLGFEVPRGEDPAHNPVFNQLLLGLLWSATTAGYRLQPFVTGKEPGSRAPHYQQLWEQREVAGFILTDLADDDERVTYLQATQVPFVLFGRLREERGYCWVDTDNAAGSILAVQHLAQQGHQHIAYLGWPASDAVADRRLAGYRQGLATAGNLSEVIAVQSYGQPAVEQALELLHRSPRPTAVVCACDEFAYDTIRAAAALGLAVGGGSGRLAVVGCDDSALAARTLPTLSSLRQPIGRLADRAIDLLTAKLANPRFEAHVLEPPQLIIRESSSAT